MWTVEQRIRTLPPPRHAAALYGQKQNTNVTPWLCLCSPLYNTYKTFLFPLWFVVGVIVTQ
jgi:hypothetical protein